MGWSRRRKSIEDKKDGGLINLQPAAVLQSDNKAFLCVFQGEIPVASCHFCPDT